MNSASEPCDDPLGAVLEKCGHEFRFFIVMKIITGRSGIEAANIPGRKKFCWTVPSVGARTTHCSEVELRGIEIGLQTGDVGIDSLNDGFRLNNARSASDLALCAVASAALKVFLGFSN